MSEPADGVEMQGTIIRLANGEYAIRGDDGKIYFIAQDDGTGHLGPVGAALAELNAPVVETKQ